jgi:hypothetical protein
MKPFTRRLVSIGLAVTLLATLVPSASAAVSIGSGSLPANGQCGVEKNALKNPDGNYSYFYYASEWTGTRSTFTHPGDTSGCGNVNYNWKGIRGYLSRPGAITLPAQGVGRHVAAWLGIVFPDGGWVQAGWVVGWTGDSTKSFLDTVDGSHPHMYMEAFDPTKGYYSIEDAGAFPTWASIVLVSINSRPSGSSQSCFDVSVTPGGNPAYYYHNTWCQFGASGYTTGAAVASLELAYEGSGGINVPTLQFGGTAPTLSIDLMDPSSSWAAWTDTVSPAGLYDERGSSPCTRISGMYANAKYGFKAWANKSNTSGSC